MYRFLCASLLLACSSFVSAEEPVKTVERILQQHAQAWNDGNSKVLASLYADDGERITSKGEVITGVNEIEKSYKSAHESSQFKDSSHKTLKVKARLVTEDVILADVKWVAAGLRDAGGNPRGDIEGRSVLVLRRKDGHWKIFSLRAILSSQ